MLLRLANVIYWLCTGVAPLFMVGAIAILRFERAIWRWLCAVLAAISYGIGRAVGYVLAWIALKARPEAFLIQLFPCRGAINNTPEALHGNRSYRQARR
jgi:hypothetical protein